MSDQSFRFNETIAAAGALLFILISILFAIMFLVALLLTVQLRATAIPLLTGSLLILPIALWGRSLSRRHRGQVDIDDQAVTVKRPDREEKIVFTEITGIREKNRNIPPDIVLVTNSGRVKISRLLDRLPFFYRLLAERVPLLSDSIKVENPFILNGKRYYYTNIFGTILVILTLFCGLGWYAVVTNNVPNPFEVLSILATSALLLSAIIIAVVVPHTRHPVVLRFESDQIIAENLYGRKWDIPLEDIGSIVLERSSQMVKTDSPVPVKKLDYPITIHLKTDRPLVIKEMQTKAFGVGPEKLILIIENLYASRVDVRSLC